jgi:hypothetical protein
MQSRMRQVYLFAVAVAFIVVLGGTALAQSSNPHIGTWKMNAAKSKYTPGPAPKSSTTKIEAAGAGVKYTVDQVSADGTMLHWEFTGNYDGKDNPVTGKNPNGDMVALTRINPNTVRLVNKMGGKVTLTQTSVVSSDGKTRTLTATGTNPQGQTVNSVTIYDKQ